MAYMDRKAIQMIEDVENTINQDRGATAISLVYDPILHLMPKRPTMSKDNSQ